MSRRFLAGNGRQLYQIRYESFTFFVTSIHHFVVVKCFVVVFCRSFSFSSCTSFSLLSSPFHAYFLFCNQARFYIGAPPKPEPCLSPKSLVTAAVCSSKTSKQLYRGRFWRVGVIDLIVLVCVLRATTEKGGQLSIFPQIFSSRTGPFAANFHCTPLLIQRLIFIQYSLAYKMCTKMFRCFYSDPVGLTAADLAWPITDPSSG